MNRWGKKRVWQRRVRLGESLSGPSCLRHASEVRVPAIFVGASLRRPYSFRDTGSDSFFGDFLSSKKTSSRPEAGTPTLPSRTLSFAVRFRPYSFLFALPSDRSVEPSSEMPAKSPRERE